MRLEGLIGERLGRYQIEALIGRGGMAAVYRAFDPALQRRVALKVLYPQFLADAELVERFRREAITSASLDHPNIAPIYDVGEVDGLVYLAMKLLPGPSLAALLLQDGPMAPARVVTLAEELAAALDEAHSHGIIHRDIKPGNVIFDARGHAVLTDFGIAKSLEASSLTESSIIVGTPDYIAPEQIDSRLAPDGKIDGRADIYSLGALLYRALTGKRPHEGSQQSVLLAHLQDPAPRPSTILPTLPTAVDDVLERAMAKRPTERYTSASELTHELRDALNDATSIGTVYPPTSLRQNIATRRTAEASLNLPPESEIQRPHIWRWIALGLLAIVGIGGAAIFQIWHDGSGLGQTANAEDKPSAIATRIAGTPSATSETATETIPILGPSSPTPTLTLVPTTEQRPTIIEQQPSAPTEVRPQVPAATRRPLASPTPKTKATPTPRVATATPRSATATATMPSTTDVAVTTTSAPETTPTVPLVTETAEPPTITPVQPTMTETAAPIDTPEPTIAAIKPTACAMPPTGGFAALWNANPRIRSQLGCPTQTELAMPAAEQVFENGLMYWWSGTQQIFVLGKRQQWQRYPNTYQDNEELEPLTPPTGFYAPLRGFGKVWQQNVAVQQTLGWALKPEAALQGATSGVYLRFEGGSMLYAWAVNGHARRIYVLYGDGTYSIFADPST